MRVQYDLTFDQTAFISDEAMDARDAHEQAADLALKDKRKRARAALRKQLKVCQCLCVVMPVYRAQLHTD